MTTGSAVTDHPSSESASTMETDKTPESTETRKTYLFGTGITNSLAPVFHNACFAARGLHNWSYSRLDSDDMEGFLAKVYEDEFGGAAVTMPHKSAILSRVDTVEPQARLIGAANTLYFEQENNGKKLVATNTDVAGIRDAIRRASSDHHPSNPRHVGLVMGGGGTTRTAVYTLRFELDCQEIFIVNRLDEEVESIIRDFAENNVHGIHHLKTPADVAAIHSTPNYIVNAVPSNDPVTDGEKRARETLNAVLAQPTSQPGIFLEMCYFPHVWTPVCDLAQQAGWTVVQGMECMYHQAIAQHVLWLGAPDETVDLLTVGRQATEDELRQRAGGAAPT